MISLLAIPLFGLTAVVILILRLLRPRFAYAWLLAALTAIIAWPLLWLAQPQLPFTLTLAHWAPAELFPVSPALLVDQISWSYALALTTLALATILTDVIRANEAGWISWVGILTLLVLGLTAVLAGNLMTMLLAWAALDLFEMVLLLSQGLTGSRPEAIAATFAGRFAGILVAVWGSVAIIPSGIAPEGILSYHAITAQTSPFLLLAAGLRLIVPPLNSSGEHAPRLRHGLGLLLQLTPAAASLTLITRSAVALSGGVATLVLAVSGILGLIGVSYWSNSADETGGRRGWIVALAALCVAAAVRGQPDASLSWGLALLLTGGWLSLYSARHPWLLPIAALSWLGLTTIPFTPGWTGALLYAPPFRGLMLLFFLIQALLLAGFIRRILRPGETLRGQERWVWLIYPWGLALLPVGQFLIAWFGALPGRTTPGIFGSWPALIVILLTMVVAWWDRWGPHPLRAIGPRSNGEVPVPTNPQPQAVSIFSLGWLDRLVWDLFHRLAHIVAFINLILEGEGGFLWTLLLLTFLLSFLIGLNNGA